MTELRLTIGDHDSTHTVRVGDRLFVELEALPGAGFQWSVEAHDDVLVEQPVRVVEGAATGIGGARVQRFEFLAAKSGEVDLHLKYGRRWEGDASTRKAFQVRVRVGEALSG
jgi:predicted secreted protein